MCIMPGNAYLMASLQTNAGQHAACSKRQRPRVLHDAVSAAVARGRRKRRGRFQLSIRKKTKEGKKERRTKARGGVGVPPLPNRLPGSCLCYRNDVPSLHGNRPGKVPMRRHVVCCKQARSVRTQKRARYAARKVGDGGRGLPGGACRSAARSFPLHAFVACFRGSGVLFDNAPRCHLDRGGC